MASRPWDQGHALLPKLAYRKDGRTVVSPVKYEALTSQSYDELKLCRRYHPSQHPLFVYDHEKLTVSIYMFN